MEETNKKYNVTDFERYYSGKMPADEMHALENAALEDPFLADALEGYEFTTNIEADISQLKARLKEKKKNKKVFSISDITQNKWWRIAALFIVIAGVGFLFYRVNFVGKEKSFANEIKSPPTHADSIASLQDSATVSADMAFQNPEVSAPRKSNQVGLAKQKNANENDVNSPVAKTQAAEAAPINKSNEGLIAGDILNNAKDKFADSEEKKFALKGKVTDEKGKPIAMASIHDDARKEIAVSDTTGNFTLRSPDSNAIATVAAVGYSTKKVILQKDDQPTIAMNKNDQNLDEVVVTTLGQKKKSSKELSRSKPLSGKVSGVQITDAVSQPFPANSEFEKYLADNIKPVFDENGDRVKGEVLLSFTINKKGSPANIKVIKSTCEGCEEEAVRLLESGPDWPGTEIKTGTVTIKF